MVKITSASFPNGLPELRSEESVRAARQAALEEAAPDLLAALKAFVAPSDPMKPTQVAPLVERARAAIAKAEGRLP